ncbi:ATP-binding protein [Bacillus sp. 37MA]|uniref:ATP-binding protein n=1 Tax=Bacillus sp. 37MA TaxID=1132442 RepID=UPI00035CF980|nr:ATP-binding protein [Bacillus sp. 37MA]
MNKNIVFISGIHGVGKTTFCKYLEDRTGTKSYSAGTLINEYINNPSISKEVSNVNGNQEILVSSIQRIILEDSFILDGHFCLLDKNSTIQQIPVETFSALSPKLFIVLYDDIKIIQERLNSRDAKVYDASLLEELQQQEISYSSHVANLLNIPVIHHCSSHDYEEITSILIDLNLGGELS